MHYVGEKVNVTYDSLLSKIPGGDENTFEKCLQYHPFLGKKKNRRKKKEGKWNICLQGGETRCKYNSDQFEFFNTTTSTYL